MSTFCVRFDGSEALLPSPVPTSRERMLQLAEQMAVQMRPNFAQRAQILCVNGAHDLVDDFVHTESLVLVGLQFRVERFQAVREATEQHILSNQRVHILNVSHV